MLLADRIHLNVPMLAGFTPKPVPALITYGVLLDCQGATGLDMLAPVNPARCGPALLRGLIWACVKRAGFQGDIREIGARIRYKNIPELRRVIGEAFKASLPEKKQVKPDKSGKKSKSKPPLDWIEIHAKARIQFGLTDDEWQAITPLQFTAFDDADTHRGRDLEIMLARLTANVINFSARAPEKAVSSIKFMLRPEEEPEEEQGELTGEKVVEIFRAFRTARGG